MKILIVEDSNEMSEMLVTILGEEYEITQAFSGTEGLMYFQLMDFDLILLDRMLPGKNGEEVLAEIRKMSEVPVIFLTALSDQSEIANLLMLGANDYLTKPFNIDELKARIMVQLRSHSTPKPTNTLCYQEIALLPDTYEIKKDAETLALKRKEFEILSLLVNHPKKVYTKEMLYQEVWGEPYYGDENTINVHVSNLRKKLKQLDCDNQYIATVWGIGIKLAEPQ